MVPKGWQNSKGGNSKANDQNQIGDISLDPTGWHFDPVTCCDFKGLMDENSKWDWPYD